MNKIIKSSAVLTICMIMAKISSFIRDMLLAYQYGTSSISDAYVIASIIPNILFNGVITALYTCYIPIYNDIQSDNTLDINLFNSNLVNVIGCVSLVLSATFLFLSDNIVGMLAAGLSQDSMAIAVTFSKIMSFSLFFMSIGAVFQGFLQANNRFYIIGLLTIPSNLCACIGILLSTKKIDLMAWGVLLGFAIYIPYLIVPVYKCGFRYKLYLHFKDKYIIKLLKLILPVFMGQMILELNVLVDRRLATGLPEGSVTSLDYAFKISSMVHSSIALPIVTVLYPKFSHLIATNNEVEMKKLLNKSLGGLLMILVPITLGLVTLAEPVVKLLLYRGAFDSEALTTTVASLQCYAISIIPIGIRLLVEKVFYSLQDTKTPMINTTISIIINIILDIVLVRVLAHRGLALATSISSIITLLLLIGNLRLKIGSFELKKIIVSFVQVTFCALIMAIVVKMSYNFLLVYNEWIALISAVSFGIIVYAFCIGILKRKELKFVKERLLKYKEKKHE